VKEPVTTSNQEAQWVLRAQCNDRDALESLLGSIQPALHRYLCRLVGASCASDVLQEVLITLFRKLTALKQPELFRAWSYRVASRIAFRHLRKEKRWQEQVNDEAVIELIPAPAAPPHEELLQALLNADVVSPASRAVLVLHFQEELPLADVAAILEIPLGTAKSRLAYGLVALRKQLNLRRSI
jgi:RNA polymerase sigma-70 factor (ECF subfamily)